MARENDGLSVGRPVSVIVHCGRVVGDVFRGCAVPEELVDVHDEDVAVAGGSARMRPGECAGARRGRVERDTSTVRRPRGGAAADQSPLITPIDVHHQKVRDVHRLIAASKAVALEDDAPAVRRYGWESITPLVVGQTARIATVAIHEIDLARHEKWGSDYIVARAHESDGGDRPSRGCCVHTGKRDNQKT